jgi:hypothetical protein
MFRSEREKERRQGQWLISRAGWKEGGKIGWWCNNQAYVL